MSEHLTHLEGKRFCVVFVKVVEPDTERVRLQCLHGRACVNERGVSLITDEGGQFCLPSTALPSIMPSDGTAMLKDAEYFAMVRTDSRIRFFNE